MIVTASNYMNCNCFFHKMEEVASLLEEGNAGKKKRRKRKKKAKGAGESEDADLDEQMIYQEPPKLEVIWTIYFKNLKLVDCLEAEIFLFSSGWRRVSRFISGSEGERKILRKHQYSKTMQWGTRHVFFFLRFFFFFYCSLHCHLQYRVRQLIVLI